MGDLGKRRPCGEVPAVSSTDWAEIRAETTDLFDPLVWEDIPDITVNDLGDNRFEIIAPYTEQTRQFFRLIAGDGQ